ncbi:MAG TPA: FG-GAP-like repeat-containing protein [Planctomycetaceae bacterium]|nr:FG-GAP-like repeat-containing protein [Planctomycetaceae bacterium]HQZ66458.1 FG-GAP-like repeat-containing protein [Planctomycetaceae bacterium]
MPAASAGRYAVCIDVLEARLLLTSDFGDAPDATAGVAVNDYQTLAANGGPSHVIDATQNTLFLGGGVDGEAGTQQSLTATLDDRFTVGGRDDEDGVLNSDDLFATAGTAPRITLAATNTTGVAAMLYGWIDYNHNGVFENATERAQIAVPTGTTNGRVTLTFPASLIDSVGGTYARFRLSGDIAAADPTGAASGGEVEDYQFQIHNRLPASFLVDYTSQFAGSSNGLPAVSNGDVFGISVASLGDLDGNGAEDVAVGAPGDSSWRGAVYVLFRNTDGSVNRSVKIANSSHGGPALIANEGFGASVASLGDIDGDGITDLAVGAYNETAASSVYIVRMNADGTAKNFTQLASQKNGIPQLADGSQFCFVRSIGDFDGDGIGDIVIGAPGTSVGGKNRGAIYIVRLNANGTAKNVTAIENTGVWNRSVNDEDNFGTTIASLGDIDHDGVGDLAVVTEGGGYWGAVNILKLKPDGSEGARSLVN